MLYVLLLLLLSHKLMLLPLLQLLLLLMIKLFLMLFLLLHLALQVNKSLVDDIEKARADLRVAVDTSADCT